MRLCRNRKAKPQPPLMGNLPSVGLSPCTLPFTFTGVDYFGPIDVAVGRRREKHWGALFTCLTTRAAHIKIASSLSAVVSDYRGASRALIEKIEKVPSGDLKKKSIPSISRTMLPYAKKF